MDKTEHALQLRRAMAQAELSSKDVALALGVSERTIVNWISRTAPTMPSDTYQEKLRRLLPGYADGGDSVEAALARTELSQWRRAAVIAEYQRHLHEQTMEDARLAQ